MRSHLIITVFVLKITSLLGCLFVVRCLRFLRSFEDKLSLQSKQQAGYSDSSEDSIGGQPAGIASVFSGA